MALHAKIVGDVSPLVSNFEGHKRYRDRLAEEVACRDYRTRRLGCTKETAEIFHKNRAAGIYNHAVGQMSPLINVVSLVNDPEDVAVELFLRNEDWFTKNGEDIASDKALLTFLGMKFVEPNEVERSISGFDIYQFRGYAIRYRDHDIKNVAESVRQLKRLIDIDPSFADRLLETHKSSSNPKFSLIYWLARLVIGYI